MRVGLARNPPGTIMMSMQLHGTRGIATVKRIQSVRNCRMDGGYTTCWAMCGSGATMESGRTRRMRRLIRWGRPVIAAIVSSGAAVGAALRGTCGRPTASGASPASAPATLASAVRVQEDGGKSMSRAGRAALSQSCLLEAKSENGVLKNQPLAQINFPVFGDLRQSRFIVRLSSK